jgi:hypothetical protein
MAIKYGISGSGYSVHNGDVTSVAHRIGAKFVEEHPRLVRKKHPRLTQKIKPKVSPEVRAARRREEQRNIAVKKAKIDLQQKQKAKDKENYLHEQQILLKEIANGLVELCCEVNEETIENIQQDIKQDGNYIIQDFIHISGNGKTALLHRLDHLTLHCKNNLYELDIDHNKSKIFMPAEGKDKLNLNITITRITSIANQNYYCGYYDILDSSIISFIGPCVLVLWHEDE